MVTIKDGCGCDPCDCDWKQKLKEAYSRAIQSVNKIGDNDGSVYYPDGTGFVKLPLPRQSDVAQIHTNTEDIADLKVQDIQLQANITTEETVRKAKDELLDADITRIDATDTTQNERIQDNADRITSTYNDLISTEATVATHDSEIITLQAQTQALSKSLVSDVMMTDGTTAGSVQVSIEREDGALITSANYRWGKDIGIRLEAGTQEGYVKAVISLSDGTELVSNEYKIVEVLESDVYVTAITLIADQAAGTLGGNISYSNGTTQTINSVSVPTAPGVTSAIEALQGRMTAVEQKNTAQDASISSLNSRVQAIEDTPGVGQFGDGKLGTIAGSTTDGRIKAEDDGTGSVNGWSALKQRVTTAEGQIVSAQNDISALDGTVAQQTADISGLMTDITNLGTSKVNVAQGPENAGKVLGIGSDGTVTPTSISVSIPFPFAEIPLSDYFTFSDTMLRSTYAGSCYYVFDRVYKNAGGSLSNVVYFRALSTNATQTNEPSELMNPTNLVGYAQAVFDSFRLNLNDFSDGTYTISLVNVNSDGQRRSFNHLIVVTISNHLITNASTEGSIYTSTNNRNFLGINRITKR